MFIRNDYNNDALYLYLNKGFILIFKNTHKYFDRHTKYILISNSVYIIHNKGFIQKPCSLK